MPASVITRLLFEAQLVLEVFFTVSAYEIEVEIMLDNFHYCSASNLMLLCLFGRI